ncbi:MULTISPECIES: YeaC family protein [unclassified Halomonas]|uniref:YeaC family protein n=1 Tax=unclassified Halomonas TaxID=2609666 RepID=UPI0021E4D5AF|nr:MULTISPECIES: YeaC family protein [unclassified Halomonas]UYG01173.1 YeaC family protein [Halomonas sp. GD1P12]WNL41080.1 YeaC family protein [Halomonas sp. PAMB 3264]
MNDMSFERMISQMTPSIYESLKQAVSLRKWPDGRFLTAEQTELCLEAVIRFEIENNVPDENRVGYLERRTCGAGATGAGVSPEMAGLGRDVSGD